MGTAIPKSSMQDELSSMFYLIQVHPHHCQYRSIQNSRLGNSSRAMRSDPHLKGETLYGEKHTLRYLPAAIVEKLDDGQLGYMFSC